MNGPYVEFSKERLAELRLKMARVEKQLESGEGLIGRWRMTADERARLVEEEKQLFQTIQAESADLKRYLEPPPQPEPQQISQMARFGRTFSTVVLGGTVFWSGFRTWAILRTKYVPYTRKQYHWRNELLKLDSNYPRGMKRIMFISLVLVLHYRRHSPDINSLRASAKEI
jgi:hypothetical protein